MSFYTSLTGINAAISRLDAASNNISNAQTDTFKRSTVSFQDLYAIQSQQLKGLTPGQGTGLGVVSQQFTQGSLVSTGNTLDLAISGDGFYSMLDKNDQAFYSRAGSFHVDETGHVVGVDGEKLLGVKGVSPPNSSSYSLQPIQIPAMTTGQYRATSNIQIGVNLPASDRVITAPFNPDDASTYNRKNIIQIYDAAGNPHNATVFYVKRSASSADRTLTEWDTHLYVDGKKIDPASQQPQVENNEKYIEWSGQGFASERFQWPAATTPDVAQGAISLIDGKVYQGNGASASIVGMVDPVLDGQNGRALRINYLEPVKPIDQVVQNGVTAFMDSGLKPIGFIPAGAENVRIEVDGFAGAEDDIQLFKADGTHLLGTPVTGSDGDATWKVNGILTAQDIQAQVLKPEYGFEFGAAYDGAPPLISRADHLPHALNANEGVTTTIDGMQISYTGDGDRSADDSDFNDGATEKSIEKVSIDKLSGPVFLMVSGAGVFSVNVTWDKMPQTTQPPINVDAIKEKIKHEGNASGIQFPIDGSEIIAGDPKKYPGFYLDSGAFIPELTIDFGKTTGYGGNYSTTNISQDGKPEGQFSSIDISRDGVVSAYYSNGHSEDLATIVLTRFNNPQGLTQLGDTQYQITGAAGPSIMNRAGYGGLGALQTGAIEQSNVDVTTELVDLIEAQRNFQSNSKAIETVDRMKKSMIDNMA